MYTQDAVGLGVLKEVEAGDGVKGEATSGGVDERVGALAVLQERNLPEGCLHRHDRGVMRHR